MQTKKFDVYGMHCKSCEILILDALEDLGVQKASFKDKELTVTFDKNKVSLEEIKQEITKDGFKVK
tara:strand:- start:505 stop:702 length:198 start_codon:yes stop_codon:yes gene_type:complete